VLGKIFPAVLCGLIPVKDGAGLGVPHHGSHQLGGCGQVSLRPPELFGQSVKTGNGVLGLGGELVILCDILLLHELKCRRHLFEVIDLCPPCIGRTFAGTQPLLYIHNQIDAARGRRHRNRLLRDRALSGDDGLDVLGIVTVPKGGRPQPGRPLLSRNKKREHTAAPMLDHEAGRLHEPEKSIKIGGAFSKSFIDGKP